jgi:hypothetical protein
MHLNQRLSKIVVPRLNTGKHLIESVHQDSGLIRRILLSSYAVISGFRYRGRDARKLGHRSRVIYLLAATKGIVTEKKEAYTSNPVRITFVPSRA